ncbi:enoyl-CoA hydratase/isomerase family protein [Rhodococcus wratislaviensis]|uniref:Putative enoyl-CoA hydratase n=1 Tax=Rhodococcus wratislaviensis NBRC 100605 TaxID=1219028 RepID=X0Q0Y5_RHOWR|nr:enoyl-CoA hydratase/isomerase family protein [Rhodococcus wratislaviensis]GAF44487.1 putative enoyl-CoA hydratase [Rhodococcus wratislaviensis NBRC 100605]
MTDHHEPGGRTHYHRDGHVAVIELDNPPLNVVSLAMTDSLDRHLAQAADDPSVRGVVITGRGDRAFCAGSDIGEFDDYMYPGRVVDLKLRHQNEVFDRLENLTKPTVAALNGLAYGGGLEIAMCCDLIVSAPGTKVALPETRLGVFPSSGGPIRLARRIGPARAKYLIFTADPIDARTGYEYGLVNELVEDGDVRAGAISLAHRLAAGPRIGLAAVKELINRSHTDDAQSLREASLTFSDQAFSSPECAAGVHAFRTRTAPNFAAADSVAEVAR